MDVKALLDWFKYNGKKYPWGQNATPYRVWISEVMLQQTVITTVIPYFQRWTERFPGIRELAAAEEDEVLRLWEGLGYYSRARNLWKAARIVAEEHNGEFPKEYNRLVKLPGIGPYTASAIMSIAFGEAYPVLDANVLRILQRLGALPQAGRNEQQQFYDQLKDAMPPGKAGVFNESLMQLGQLICRNTAPLCFQCPLAGDCKAFQENLQEEIPAKEKRRIVEKETHIPLLCVNRKEIYILTREEGLFSGLWIFPGWKARDVKCQPLKKILSEAVESHRLMERTHFYTRYKDRLIPTLYIFTAKPSLEGISDTPGEWLPLKELSSRPMPSVYRKIAEELLQRAVDSQKL